MRGDDGKQSERKWRGNNESNEETLREEGDGEMWRSGGDDGSKVEKMGLFCWEQPVCKDNSHQQTDERTFND